jgi:hypothetical protein
MHTRSTVRRITAAGTGAMLALSAELVTDSDALNARPSRGVA